MTLQNNSGSSKALTLSTLALIQTKKHSIWLWELFHRTQPSMISNIQSFWPDLLLFQTHYLRLNAQTQPWTLFRFQQIWPLTTFWAQARNSSSILSSPQPWMAAINTCKKLLSKVMILNLSYLTMKVEIFGWIRKTKPLTVLRLSFRLRLALLVTPQLPIRRKFTSTSYMNQKPHKFWKRCRLPISRTLKARYGSLSSSTWTTRIMHHILTLVLFLYRTDLAQQKLQFSQIAGQTSSYRYVKFRTLTNLYWWMSR